MNKEGLHPRDSKAVEIPTHPQIKTQKYLIKAKR